MKYSICSTIWEISQCAGAAALIAAAPVSAQVPAPADTAPLASQLPRSDPIVIVDGARVDQRTLRTLQGRTVTAEILRGEDTKPFGADAEGGVIRITIPVAPTAPPSLRALLSAMGNHQDRRAMGDTSGDTSARQPTPPVSGAASHGPPLYPIVILDGSRVTDDSLYKLKSTLDRHTVFVLDAPAATGV